MAGTLFFVHGTGVRKSGYERTLAAVQDGARRNGVPAQVFVGCPWGQALGVPTDRIADTLPREVATRSALGTGPSPSEGELRAATWALLLDDPLFELRLAGAAAPAGDGGIVVGEARADQAAVAMVRSLPARMPDLAGTGLTAEEITAAAVAVADSPELSQAALAAGSAANPELVEAIAEAVVAWMLAAHRLDPPGTAPTAVVSGAARDGLVERVADALVPVETRGAVQGLARPVVAVGHSLGGIVLVDLLTREGATPVDLLVTAGSQSPLFYVIDALDRLRPGKAMPAPPVP